MAVAALAACNKYEVLETPQGTAIAFDNVFVNHSTKAADLDKSNLQDFGVYGFVQANGTEGQIFTNQKVQKDGSAYTYNPVQYWIAKAQYYFTAFAPYTSAAWKYTTTDAQNGTVSFNNETAGANQDFLFAYTQPGKTPDAITSAPAPVAFDFSHMLSRVKFTFTNAFAEGSNIELLVTDVHVTDAYKTGTIEVANGETAATWTPADKTFDIAFGNVGTANLAENGGTASTEHFYLIPAEANYVVTFKIALYQAGVLVDNYTRSASVDVNMLRGNSYELKASLNAQNTSDDGELYPIEFTVNSVEKWEDFQGVDAQIATNVATAEELIAAVAEGGFVTLTEDIDLGVGTKATAMDYGLNVTANTVIDGAGHTLTCSAVRALNIAETATDVTIKNLNVVGLNERAINIEGANKTVAIESVTAEATHYTVNLVGSADNVTVNIENSTLTGLNVINVWGEGTKVTVKDTKIVCVDDSNTEGYAAITINEGANGSEVIVNGGEVVLSGSEPSDSFGGVIGADDANITFNGTTGACTIIGEAFMIRYGEYHYSFETFEEALAKAEAGETIVLTKDITIQSHLNINKSIVFDLNGKTLTAAKEGAEIDAIWVRDNAEVVITGNGVVNATYDAVFATGTSKVTIENGTFTGAAEAVFAQANASVVINGGSYKSTEYPGFTLNLKDSARATASILVNGGSFYNFNPADNAAEGEHTNFVAAGKTVEQDGDWYVVK